MKVTTVFRAATAIGLPRSRYADRAPAILDPHRKDLMERLLLRKATFWAHEHEWRIIQSGKIGAWQFPPELLKGVIFGANIAADHEAALRAIFAKRSGVVDLKRAVLDAETFDLRVMPA